MRRFFYLLAGFLFGIFLAYVSFNLMLHVASLFMESDDDLNRAVYCALFFAPVIVSLSLYFFYVLCSRSETKSTRAVHLFFCAWGAFVLMLLGYFLFGMSVALFDLREWTKWANLTRAQERIFLFIFLAVNLGAGGILAWKKSGRCLDSGNHPRQGG